VANYNEEYGFAKVNYINKVGSYLVIEINFVKKF